MNFYSETVPCLVLAALGSEAGRCLPRLCLLRAPFEECKTHLLSGHNISASVGLGEIEVMRKMCINVIYIVNYISLLSLLVCKFGDKDNASKKVNVKCYIFTLL